MLPENIYIHMFCQWKQKPVKFLFSHVSPEVLTQCKQGCIVREVSKMFMLKYAKNDINQKVFRIVNEMQQEK